MGIENFSFFGPKNLLYYIQSNRYVIKRKVRFDIKEICDFELIFKDENITIYSKSLEFDEDNEHKNEDKENKNEDNENKNKGNKNENEDNIKKNVERNIINHHFEINKKSKPISSFKLINNKSENKIDIEVKENKIVNVNIDTNKKNKINEEYKINKKQKIMINNESEMNIESKKPSISIFICKTKDLPGKFDAEKAKKLGLKPGPLYRDLVNGIEVKLENGNIIKPSIIIF
jgi:hypothetical protein